VLATHKVTRSDPLLAVIKSREDARLQTFHAVHTIPNDYNMVFLGQGGPIDLLNTVNTVFSFTT
jgi:hypothetical protein